MKTLLTRLWVVFCILLPFDSQTQPKEDSLLFIANNTDNDSLKYIQFYYLITGFKYHDLEKVKTYTDSIANIYDRTANKKYLGMSEYYYGFYHRKKNQFDQAIKHYQTSKQASIDIDYPSMYAVSIAEIAGSYMDQNQLVNALKIFFEAEEFNLNAKDHNAQSRLSNTYNNIGLVYGRLSNYEKALDYYRLAIKEATDNDDKNVPLGNAAEIFMEIGELDSMKLYAEHCYQLCLEMGEPRGIAYSEWLRAAAAFKMGDYVLAEKSGLKAVNIYQTYPEKILMLDAYYILARAQMKNGKIRQAIKNTELTLDLAREMKDYELQSVGYELMSTLHEVNNNLNQALVFHKMFKASEDSIILLQEADKINELTIKYETAQKNEQIANQKIELNKQDIQRNSLLSGFGIVTLLGTFIFYRLQNKQKMNQQAIKLLKQEQKLLAIDYMVQGQEEERKRIALDLHDGLGGILSSAKIQMQTIQREIDKMQNMNLISKAQSLIDSAYAEVRRISHDMMPGALIELGLFEAVQDLITDINQNQNFTIKTEWYLVDTNIPQKLQIILYRIVQEALTNIVKHAQANLVIIQMTESNDSYILTIEDDGIGFDVNENSKRNGIGLKSIRSRVNYLNGELTIRSDKGEGTSLEIYIPRRDAYA